MKKVLCKEDGIVIAICDTAEKVGFMVETSTNGERLDYMDDDGLLVIYEVSDSLSTTMKPHQNCYDGTTIRSNNKYQEPKVAISGAEYIQLNQRFTDLEMAIAAILGGAV